MTDAMDAISGDFVCDFSDPKMRGLCEAASIEDPKLSFALTESLFLSTQAFWLKWLSKCTYKVTAYILLCSSIVVAEIEVLSR